MIDIEAFDKALKLTWIRRFFKGGSKWKYVITEIYPKLNNIMKYGNNYVFQLKNDIDNPFWSALMQYLFEFHKKFVPSCLEEFYVTSFLYNDKIKIDRRVITNKTLERRDIFLIKHLMENDQFMSYNQFSMKYDLQINQLTYISIIRAIKLSLDFNDLEKQDCRIEQQLPFHHIMKAKRGASNIYEIFIENKIESKGSKKWAEAVGLSEEDWISGFSFLKFTTKDTKLRWFQLRILHSILTTNRSASKFIEGQTDLCTFCNNHSETIKHLFWDCENVKIFWLELTNMINNRCKHSHQFKVNVKLVLFGQSEYLYTDEVCNLIILLAKLYIYRSKVNNSALSLRCFIRELFARYNAEKNICNSSQQFINNWSNYLDLFKSLI